MNNVLKCEIENQHLESFESLKQLQSHFNLKLSGIVPFFPAGILRFSGINIKAGLTLNIKNLI